MQQYHKTEQKMIQDFADVTRENIKNTIQIGCRFLMIHTEH